MPFKKYDSQKLGWCNYPFENNPLGYCWSYANFIDGDFVCKGVKITDMTEFCKTCDMNKKGG